MAHLIGGNYDPDPGDSIRLHRQDDTGRVSHKVRTVTVDEKGRRFIDIPQGFKRGDSVYLLQTKSMSKRYPRVLPADLGKYRQQPGDEILPVLDITPVEKNELSYFPEGLYIQVSTVSDLFQVISKNPVRIILEYNSETKNDLLIKKTKLPLSKKQLIISLDPYCPASKEAELSDELDSLVSDGYKTFVVNNIAHISMLKGKNANMIAGPYLYTFNRWAASWFENQSIGAFITPLENSWDNLKETWEPSVRDRVLVTAYAYPALFRMRFRLPESYDFLYFKDKEEALFKVSSTVDGSVVMPESPFSIVDKSEILNSSGFKRILLDFSRTKVSRQELKLVTNSMIKRQPVPESTRFNWKDGFYSPEKIEIYKAMNEKASAEKEAGIKNGRSPKKTVRGSDRAYSASRKPNPSKAKGRKRR